LRFLFFSDVHSNLEALAAVLDDASVRGFDRAICLGDIVGYGASPEECVKKISGLTDASAVLGNHDAAVVNPSERVYLNPVALAGVKFSETQLTADSLAYLGSLKFIFESDDDFIASHASPYKPESWVYVLEPVEASDAFHVMTHRLAFIGHTHFPVLHNSSGLIKPILPGDRIEIQESEKTIINVGSVGQPRDGDPRAAYIIYDDEIGVVEVFRVEYDIETASQKILDAGLPPMLADRIRRGY
jgi:diadenosine tetraphosphatase ApaH/serine/threonine PP2A family protein phosphatase